MKKLDCSKGRKSAWIGAWLDHGRFFFKCYVQLHWVGLDGGTWPNVSNLYVLEYYLVGVFCILSGLFFVFFWNWQRVNVGKWRILQIRLTKLMVVPKICSKGLVLVTTRNGQLFFFFSKSKRQATWLSLIGFFFKVCLVIVLF